jgi:hypothetical protein
MSNPYVRTAAIMKALVEGEGCNELAFYALVLQYNAHPNKKRWNIIFKIFLMPRNSDVPKPWTLNGLYLIDPEKRDDPARQALRQKYRDEIFPQLLEIFNQGDPTHGRKKLGLMEKLGQKMTSYKRKVGSGDFDRVVAQICREGGPIDKFAQGCTWGDLTQNYYTSPQLNRNQIHNTYGNPDDPFYNCSRDFWLSNLQRILPQYGLDPADAGLGLEPWDV